MRIRVFARTSPFSLPAGVVVAAWLVFPALCAVVDRIAVVVGKTVITESEVLQELKLTGFLNEQPLDLGAPARRAAAERLVDQQLIRSEMEIGRYPEPTASEAQAVLRKFQQEHYRSDAEFHAALEKYGITEEQLQQHLIWQLATIHFTDLRFSSGASAPQTDAQSTGADRTATSSKENPQAAPEPATGTVDQQMDAWLKEARSQVRIQFKKEAFE